MKVYGLETSPYTWPYAHITFDTLKEAKTITDLYSRFQSKWVATYHSVKMTCTCGGNIQTAFSKDEVLTSEQLQILTNVTEACNIQFTIEYTPRNNLKENPRKEMVIDLSLIPIFEASYSGGYSELYKWLKSQGLKTDFPYSKVHFTISPTGNVSNLTVIELSGDPLFEKELPSALAKTKWTPAREGSGI
ncbi:MAG: energy transducer TonB, partial [Saprospiraceae bacterium]|nr:energy transducer TonB [Saprospiraceae bacterium]